MTCEPDAEQERRRRARAWQRRHTRMRRAIVLTHYGGRCECCGETRMKLLQIDHIGGGGAAHRRLLAAGPGLSGQGVYRQLIIQGFPDGFRVLCVACNWATGDTDGGPCRCRELPTLPEIIGQFTPSGMEREIHTLQANYDRRSRNDPAVQVPHRRLRRGRWSRTERTRLEELLRAGHSLEEISERLERSLVSTQSHARGLDEVSPSPERMPLRDALSPWGMWWAGPDVGLGRGDG